MVASLVMICLPRASEHDNVIKWKHFSRYWPFVRGIARSPVASHKGLWRGTLMFSLNCAWTNGRANNRGAGDLRRHCAHYGVNLMKYLEPRGRNQPTPKRNKQQSTNHVPISCGCIIFCTQCAEWIINSYFNFVVRTVVKIRKSRPPVVQFMKRHLGSSRIIK